MASRGTNTQAKDILTKLSTSGAFVNLFILPVNMNSLPFAAILCCIYFILLGITDHREFAFLILYLPVAYKVAYQLEI